MEVLDRRSGWRFVAMSCLSGGTRGPGIHAHLVVSPALSCGCTSHFSIGHRGPADGEGAPFLLLPLASGGDCRACHGIIVDA